MSKGITRELFRLGWPVLVAQLAVMANGVIDTVMAGRYNSLDLAAVGIGASIYVSVFISLMGVLLALTPTIAQLYGAGRHGEIGEQVRQGAWLALGLMAIALMLLRHPEPFLALSGLQPAVEAKVRAYLDAIAWGMPAALLFRVFYGFSTAISQPRPIMVLNLIGLALKVPLNWVFMQGFFGAPAMGGPGCAVASSLIAWMVLGLAALWCAGESAYRPFGIFARWSWPQARVQARLLKLGVPIGATFLVDVTAFTFMALFIARLGPISSGAHQIAANLAALTFMLPLALGHAASVLVGQALGARDARRARHTGFVAITIGLVVAAAVSLVFLLGADMLAGLYTRDAAVRRLAAVLLGYVAVYHLFDAMQAVVVNVLRGHRKTLVPMLVYAVALWGLGLGGGYALGLGAADMRWAGLATPMGAPGFWLAAILSLSVAGSTVTLYLVQVSKSVPLPVTP